MIIIVKGKNIYIHLHMLDKEIDKYGNYLL